MSDTSSETPDHETRAPAAAATAEGAAAGKPRRRRRRWRRGLLIGLVVLVAIAAYAIRDPSPVGYWRSAEGLAAYTEAYEEALEQMPGLVGTTDLRTSYGVVRAYEFHGDALDPEHSFGGWTVANLAIHHPERVASLSLLDPVYVFDEIPLGTVLKTIPASLPFLPESWRESMLEDIGGGPITDPDDPVVRVIDAGTEHFAIKLPLPGPITGPELKGTPLDVALAENSVMHDVDDAQAAAEAALPDAVVQVWPGTSHSLPMELVGQIEPVLLEFMAAND